MITWETLDSNQDGNKPAIKAQIFNADATMCGYEFLVNTEFSSNQLEAEIVTLSNGKFVVTWQSKDSSQDGSKSSIMAQIFNADGSKFEAEFLVNTEYQSNQTAPEITFLENGNFVITWQSNDSFQDSSNSAIKAQIFDSTGGFIGGEFLDNSEFVDSQKNLEFTGLNNGGFVIVLETFDELQDGNEASIKAQVYNADGTKLGGEFLVNSQRAGNQIIVNVTATDNGGFVIV